MMAKPFIVALTGGIGSGKSTVARLFAERGIAVIDTDALAHGLTAPGGAAITAISQAFGTSFINADGALDRAKMRDLVFADTTAKTKLEKILHPMIREQSQEALQDANSAYVVVDVPLLCETAQHENSWAQRASRILVVDCPTEMQIERTIARALEKRKEVLSRQSVESIIALQATRQARLALADDVIDNSGPSGILPDRIEALHQLYLRLSRASV
jgi:dephospho-CoA kinase